MHNETPPSPYYSTLSGILSLPIPTQHSITHNPHGGRGINNHTDNRPGRDTTQGFFLPEPDVGIMELDSGTWNESSAMTQSRMKKISKKHAIQLLN